MSFLDKTLGKETGDQIREHQGRALDPKSNIWKKRIDRVLANPGELRQAAAVWVLLRLHEKNCLHQRECREKQLMTEAYDIVRMADREETKQC